jgi:hypothetical protein
MAFQLLGGTIDASKHNQAPDGRLAANSRPAKWRECGHGLRLPSGPGAAKGIQLAHLRREMELNGAYHPYFVSEILSFNEIGGDANIRHPVTLARGMCAMTWGKARSTILLSAFTLAGCVQPHPIAQWQQPQAPKPRTLTVERTYIETPVPAKFVESQQSVLKSASGSTAVDGTQSDEMDAAQKTSDRTASLTMVEPIAVKSAGADGASRLIGMNGAEASKLLGQPTETKESNLSWIWTYRAPFCTLKLFFYPTGNAADFRALTYQVEEQKAADTNHAACLAQIAKSTPD